MDQDRSDAFDARLKKIERDNIKLERRIREIEINLRRVDRLLKQMATRKRF